MNRRRISNDYRSRIRTPALLRVERLEQRVLLHCDHFEPPHGDDPILQAEHMAVMDLVPCDKATHRAVTSGEWDNALTWDHGIPSVGADVLIPEGTSVLIDSVLSPTLRTVRIDGELSFSTTVNTALRVDTIVVTPGGILSIGTPEASVSAYVQAKITFADRGPIDTTWDPNQFSRGLISHGTVMIHGAAKTAFLAVAGDAKKKSSEITLSAPPVGWSPGDQLILSGVKPTGKQDERFDIRSVSGSVVTINGRLRYDHAVPRNGLSAYVANVSRNVILQSENTSDISRRGHTMFMHSPHVKIDYAGFYGLGRTDKRVPLNNVQLDSIGHPVPGTGTNPVGRYAAHFHRTGVGPGASAAIIRGSVVVDSPGWGIVNHSSDVIAEDNVVYNAIGAAYVAEAGNEIGAFRHNIAIRSPGSSDSPRVRRSEQDFAHKGYGFWLQGAGTDVVDNVAVSQAGGGFSYFTRGLTSGGQTTQFAAYNLADASVAGDREWVEVGEVPIRRFEGNTVFASTRGLEIWYHLGDVRHNIPSVIDHFAAWNIRETPVFVAYARQIKFTNDLILGNPKKPAATAIAVNEATRDIEYQDVRVEGFGIGIASPLSGNNSIHGGYYNNIQNISFATAAKHGRVVDIASNVQFAHPNGTGSYVDVYLKEDFDPKDQDITKVFNADRITDQRFPGRQLYFKEQSADFVPFRVGVAPSYVPSEFIGKTNQQLFDLYGLAIGGSIAPANSVANSAVYGLIGDPAKYLPDLELVSDKYTKQLVNYQLIYKDKDGARVLEPTPIQLRLGWNLITRSIEGQNRTFLVLGIQ